MDITLTFSDSQLDILQDALETYETTCKRDMVGTVTVDAEEKKAKRLRDATRLRNKVVFAYRRSHGLRDAI